MKQRCTNDYTDRSYRYKARGITVCEEWMNSFIAYRDWALSNGYREGLQIDRRDNNGNYTPENCRFVPQLINANNREVTTMIDYNGKNVSLSLLLHEMNIYERYNTVRNRVLRGWTHQQAVDTPIRQGNYKRKTHEATH